MAFTIVGSAVHANTAANNVDTITFPTGIAAGDGALLFISYASSAITVAFTDNGLSGPFTQVGATASFSGHQSQLWSLQGLAAGDSGKVLTLTESTAIRIGAVLVVYRGVPTTGLVNAFTSKTSTSGTVSPSTPTVVTAASGCARVEFVGMTRGATTPQIATVTPPAGTTIAVTDFDPAAGAAVTSQAVIGFEGHNLTGVTNGATIGGTTYTVDVSAVYSAWTVALAPAQTGPTVDAGAQQVVPAGTTVTLTGTETAASGTTITARSWTATTYPGATAPTLTGGTTATATMANAAAGKYVFRYRVTDSTGAFTDATVTVYVTTADARPTGTPTPGVWTPVGATTIHAALADTSDATYAQAVSPAGSSFTVDLPPAPVGSKTVTYGLQLDPTSTGSVTYLVEYLAPGVVASKNETVTGTAVLAGSFTLTDTQNANVTDPLNHQLRVTATATG
jgi:hypothetical protein